MLRIVHQRSQAPVVPGVQNASVIGIRDEAWVHMRNRLLCAVDELILTITRQKHIIRSDASLPRVVELAGENSRRRRAYRITGMDQCRALAPELERHRREILARRLHYQLA